MGPSPACPSLPARRAQVPGAPIPRQRLIRDIDKELGIEETLAVEASEVSVRTESRRYGKSMTVLEGFDPAVDVQRIAKDLKSHLGTGGTSKRGVIELQGDHREKARGWLRQAGFTVR